MSTSQWCKSDRHGLFQWLAKFGMVPVKALSDTTNIERLVHVIPSNDGRFPVKSLSSTSNIARLVHVVLSDTEANISAAVDGFAAFEATLQNNSASKRCRCFMLDKRNGPLQMFVFFLMRTRSAKSLHCHIQCESNPFKIESRQIF
jgi:hypothetical protein